MALNLYPASDFDADCIADIHIAAFGANALLRAQFPTAAIRSELRKCIAQKASDDIRDPKKAVLVVKDGNEIISFAKWDLPVFEGETYVERPWVWPEGTNLAVLDEWMEKVEEAEERVVGGQVCYHLSFIGTHPSHRRRSAASMLLQWGLQRAVKDNAPAYLESTIDAAPLYEKNGFRAAEKLSMILEGISEDGAPVVYEETCFIFRPSVSASTSNDSFQPLNSTEAGHTDREQTLNGRLAHV